jgi:hypothetical protein
MSIIIGAILIKMAIGGAKGAALHPAGTAVGHGALTGTVKAGALEGGKQILAMESIRNAAGHVLASGSPHLAANAGIGVSHVANAAGVAHAAGVHKAATLTTRQLYDEVALGGFTVANMTVDKLIDKIRARAKEISRGPNSRGEWDNWLAAEREVLTRERAAELAKTSSATDRENWLRAEFEVITSQRARGIANSDESRGNDVANWLAGEEEARIVLRAEAISKRNPELGDLDVWLAAKRELGLA